jgi:hypothetical protein
LFRSSHFFFIFVLFLVLSPGSGNEDKEQGNEQDKQQDKEQE